MSQQILVGIFRDVAWIRVQGKGSFENSPGLRSFVQKLLDEGRNQFVVDLEECSGMDSTFMGTLTGVALLLADRPTARMQVINADDRNLKLIRTLGLDRVIEVDVDGKAWRQERALVKENVSRSLEGPSLCSQEKRIFIKEAHEALCEANEENSSRFRDVLEYLGGSSEK
ncbi:MAG: STAS domain-containing protein [Verrucomicrobiota bacterium]